MSDVVNPWPGAPSMSPTPPTDTVDPWAPKTNPAPQTPPAPGKNPFVGAAGALGSASQANDEIFHKLFSGGKPAPLEPKMPTATPQRFAPSIDVMSPQQIGAPQQMPPMVAMSDRRVKTNIRPADTSLRRFLDAISRGGG